MYVLSSSLRIPEPYLLLENSRPLSPWGPPDFLSTCLGIDSLKGKVEDTFVEILSVLNQIFSPANTNRMVLNNHYRLISAWVEESTLAKQILSKHDSKIYDQTLIIQFFPRAIA